MSHKFAKQRFICTCLFAVFVFSFACILTVVPSQALATANNSIDTKAFTDQFRSDISKLVHENVDKGSSSKGTAIKQVHNVQGGQNKTILEELRTRLKKDLPLKNLKQVIKAK